MLLSIQHLSCRFGGIVALDGVDFAVDAGEVVALIGPNGSGKTTLLNCITGIARPDAGKVLLHGRDVSNWPTERRAREGIARTFQDPRIFPSLSVVENMLLSLSVKNEGLLTVLRRSYLRASEARTVRRARELLAEVGLDDARNQLAGSLSYGQRRLLDLARALASDAALYLIDEPTSGVAHALIGQVLAVFRRLRDAGRAVLFIEHDFETLAMATRVILLEAGRKVLDCAPDAVRADPKMRRLYFGSAA